jgi:hypothetical protein
VVPTGYEPARAPGTRAKLAAALRLAAGRIRLKRRTAHAGTLAIAAGSGSDDAEAAIQGLLFDAARFESRLAWILGAPRTGSTWLLRMAIHPWILARGNDKGMRAPLRMRRGDMPDVVPVDETYLLQHLTPLRPLPDHLAEQPATDEFVINGVRRAEPSYFFSDQYADSWRPELRRLVLARLHAQADRAATAHALNDPLLLIKEPNGSHGAELLMSLVPRSRLVFLLRDGRDVIDSLLDARGGEGWVATPNMDLDDPAQRLAYVRHQARLWLNCTNAVQSAYAAHPPVLRITVRYEDLRQDPMATLPALMEWLGLGRSKAQIAEAVAANSFESIPGRLKGPGTPRRAATPGLWRERLAPAEREAIAEIIGPKLAELGYEAS